MARQVGGLPGYKRKPAAVGASAALIRRRWAVAAVLLTVILVLAVALGRRFFHVGEGTPDVATDSAALLRPADWAVREAQRYHDAAVSKRFRERHRPALPKKTPPEAAAAESTVEKKETPPQPPRRPPNFGTSVEMDPPPVRKLY